MQHVHSPLPYRHWLFDIRRQLRLPKSHWSQQTAAIWYEAPDTSQSLIARICSQPVVPASVANGHQALPTLIDPVHVLRIAELTLILRSMATNAPEAIVLALVIVTQVLNRALDAGLALADVFVRARLKVDDGFSAFDEAVFVPLGTIAVLPLDAA